MSCNLKAFKRLEIMIIIVIAIVLIPSFIFDRILFLNYNLNQGILTIGLGGDNR
jgi:hypothetical protein